MSDNSRTGLEIAVIGMAGRFPGANNIHRFWENLKNGVESISFFSNQELEETGVDEDLINNPAYVKARGALQGAEYFDASFFGYTPAEAKLMDPQVRIFHECCWEAMENAGYSPDGSKGKIGIYAGSTANLNWQALTVLSGAVNELDPFSASQLINKDYLTTRISYRFNLKGPSFVVQTACSTSLVAIHLASQGLLSGECGMALAGGITVNIPQKHGYLYQEGMVLSPDGHCRAFDAKASGFAGGDGSGVVVLKLLEDALEDGDYIYAVIKGSAINNDGSQKSAYTAPSINAQAAVIKAALGMAEVESESISYVETHGTGTPLGDPIEIESLKRAFNTDKKGFCKIGSVKTNVGHLDAAAGVAGFIKTVLALQQRQLPPSLFYETPNPKIDFENSPFKVNTQLTPWEHPGYPLRAGVTSLGIGGTNAHVVLEEAPVVENSEEGRVWKLLVFSGNSRSALDKTTENITSCLQSDSRINLADAAFTLQVGRKALQHRRMVMCSSADDAIDKLSDIEKTPYNLILKDKRRVVFMFAGLGAQYVDMCLDLYKEEPGFREEMDRCFHIMDSLVDYNIKEILFPSASGDSLQQENQGKINRIDISQVVVFIVEYALARLLLKWGVKPHSMIGYSFGEYTAACLSGVFSLEDALKIIVCRGNLLLEIPGGAMLSVPVPTSEVSPMLPPELSIAIDNGSSCIVSGPGNAVSAFEGEMKRKRLLCMPVPHSVAMHSAMVEPILVKFENQLKKIQINPPKIPYISNLTGSWINAGEVVKPSYWTRHLSSTVRFSEGITELVKIPNSLFVEIGPGRDLSTMVKRFLDNKTGQKVLNLVRPPQKKVSDEFYFFNKIGYLWLYGVDIDWKAFYAREKRCRVPLPTYPFEGKRYWFDGDPLKIAAEVLSTDTLPREKNHIKDWLYVPQWKRSILTTDTRDSQESNIWLLFIDDSLLSTRLVQHLKNENHTVIIARSGHSFQSPGDHEYTINPAESEDYKKLFKVLVESGSIPTKILHLWNLPFECDSDNKITLDSLERSQDSGLYSLLNIAQAIGHYRISDGITIGIVTYNMQPVTGDENLRPEQATLLGPVKVIPLEYPNIKCLSIDIANPGLEEPRKTDFIVGSLVNEFYADIPGHRVVAYRGTYRWIEGFEAVESNIDTQQTPIKEKGVYLVTGGFGGIGFTLVEHLAETLQARLILVDILTPPAGEKLDEWLYSEQRKKDIQLKKQRIKELEEIGAEIQVHDADVSDYEQMQQVISEAEERFGKINGVIHTAGLIDYAGVIQMRTRQMTDELLAAKVKGTLVLDTLLKHHPIDFMVLFSSVGNIFYKMKFGQVAYNAGHEFLTVYAYQKQQQGIRAITIDWNDWQERGMAVRAAEKAGHIDEEPGVEDLLAITPSEGSRVFNHILGNHQLCRVVVCPVNLEAAVDFMESLSGETTGADTPGDKGADEVSEELLERPNLSTPYEAATDDIQEIIARTWESFFGIKQVGIHDDFFELGGDSLKAMNVSAIIQKKLNVEVPVVEFFNRQTVKGIAEFVKTGTGKKDEPPLEPAEIKEYYPVSSAQRRLFVLQQLEKESTGYNEPLVIRLEGNLVRERFEDTFERLIRRHEGMRTSFHIIEGKPVQKIHHQVPFAVDYIDNSEAAAQNPGNPVQAHSNTVDEIVSGFIKPFDLSQAPLFRVGVVQEQDSRYVMIVDMHHIIRDGVSQNVLINDFMAFYKGRELQDLRIQYKDFSQWQNHLFETGKIKKQEEFWLNMFKDEIPVLNLPTDFLRPAIQSFEGRQITHVIGREEAIALKELASQHDATLFMILLALFNVLLSKLSGQEDIICGTVVAGRRHAELQGIIGMFVNTLALRNFPKPENTFADFLKNLVGRTLDAFDNQDYQFETLVGKVVENRDTSRNPLFDVMFAYHNYLDSAEEISKSETDVLKVKPYDFQYDTSIFDLTLNIIDSNGELHVAYEYCTRLFKQETIERFMGYFRKIAVSIITDPHIKISDIEILSGEEKKHLLYDFNDTGAEYPGEKTIHRLFEEQVARTPDAIAVVGHSLETSGEVRLTYRELNRGAVRVAHRLKAGGIDTDSIAAVMLSRSIEMVVGILGILESGGAYMPIDPGYPTERTRFMLADSNAEVLLTTRNFHHTIDFEKEIICLDDDWDVPQGKDLSLPAISQPANSMAYIIYTSGSTGNPKGVVVEHQSVVNVLNWFGKTYDLRPGIHVMQLADFTFDASVEQIFGALLHGAVLHVIPKEDRADSEILRRYIRDKQVNILDFVPVMLRELLVDRPRLKSLKTIISGGEKLHDELKDKIIERQYNLYNHYGPTETAIEVLTGECSREPVTLGKSISNTRAYILDKNLRLQPLGFPGELCISGTGLARGYLNRSELTAERFIRNPFFPEERMYRTGDLARRLPGGNIEFLGRIDQQVKIRGFRIELGEIKSQLLKLEAIKEVVVVQKADPNQNNYLCAYICSDIEITAGEAREFLSGKLPDYMVPSFFVQVNEIPLTPSGKVDAKALPEPEDSGLDNEIEYAAPRNEIEKKLALIWENVLGRKKVGINENFFMIGGDSIKSIQINSRMKKEGYKIEMSDILKYPSIAELASRVKKLDRISEQGPVTGEIPLIPIQRQHFIYSQTYPHHFNHSVMFYSKEGFQIDALKAVFGKIQEHHDALRMTYKRVNGEFLQINHDLDYPLSIQEYDLKNTADSVRELGEKANEIQAGIDLEKGPLMKIGLFRLPDGDRLLIVIHHLVVDGVSWRILFEDIESLYQQYLEGKQMVLPLKTDSFKVWAEKLSGYADSPGFLKEKSYWAQKESVEVPPLPKDFDEACNYIEDSSTLSFELNEEDTNLLLTRANEAFGTEINDTLLTALGLGVKKSFGLDKLLIALEGHGREELFKDVDISRTIGWFTSLYPVCLEIAYVDDPGRQLKEVKESLRKIPNRGIGHGILKYLTAGEYKKGVDFKLNPQISFNYLGQFDSDVQQMAFDIAKESPGDTQCMEDQREFEIDVLGMTSNNRLEISITYNIKQYKTETIQALLDSFKSELVNMIHFCSSQKKRELTPSDFTYKGLSIDAVERLTREYSIQDIYKLTPMQEGMLFYAVLDNASSAYFEQTSYRLHGELDVLLVEKSLNELVRRHDVLRTAIFREGLEVPLQVVLKERKCQFIHRDIREMDDKEAYVASFKEQDRRQVFDLLRDPLMRVSVLRVDDREFEITWSFHHILMDGWCVGILNTEFFEIYESLLQEREYRLPEVYPYRTYIEWLENQDNEVTANYWKDYLSAYEVVSTIPKRSIKLSEIGEEYKVEHHRMVLDEAKAIQLNDIVGRNQVTMNSVIQTIWGIILGRYNGREDVVFGSVVSGRPVELDGVENMVGLFINTIPVRIQFDETTPFHTLLKKTQDEAIAGDSHHYFSLADIQSGSSLGQDLLDHILVFENYPIAEQMESNDGEPGQNSEAFRISNVDIFEQTNYDFNILVLPGINLEIKFDYNSNVYDPEFIKKIATHFELVFTQVIADEQIPIGQITLLSEEEKNQVLYAFNDSAISFPEDKTLHRLFRETAVELPGNIAVVDTDNESLTYRMLDIYSDRLASTLIEKGLGDGDIAAILVEQSILMFIGILGVLKTGAAYLPVDTRYPDERIQFMLADSAARILLTTNELSGSASFGNQSIYLEDEYRAMSGLPAPETRDPQLEEREMLPATNVAYVIYTSGSTGRPKGTLTSHRSANNFSQWHNRRFSVTAADRTSKFASISFDASVWEIYPYLFVGASIYIVDEDIKSDIFRLNCFFEEKKITVSFLPTQLCEQIMTLENNSLRYLLAGGDKLRSFIPRNYGMINGYGPTENTVITTTFEVDGEYRNIPIGKPIDNNLLYVLDKHMRVQPVGVPGELCVSGAGLGLGYLNRPELTSEKFMNIRLPGAGPSELIPVYRTGDLVRWLPDGNLQFLGRIDGQVKIRGFRVELGEIEHRLMQHPHVHDTIVIVKEDKAGTGDKYICAYIVTGDEVPVSELEQFLSVELPDFMIPSFFISMEKLPLNPNGKIDKRALPEPEKKIEGEFIAPRSDIEKVLAEIWADILEIETGIISIDANFFQLGGHSLKATVLATRVHKELDVRIPLTEVFRKPTIEDLASYIEALTRDKHLSIESAGKKEYYVLSSAQKRIFVLEEMLTGSDAYNIPGLIPLAEDVKLEKLEEIFVRLIQRHESFRTSFDVVNEEPVQRIHDHVDFEIEYHDAAGTTVAEIFSEFVRPFDLTQPPLLRVGLIRVAGAKNLLMMDMHHIISDGLSHNLLGREVLALYAGETLPPLRIQYKDFAEWQAGDRQKEAIKQQELYWLETFAGEIPVLDLPYDYSRPAVQSFEGNTVDVKISGDTVRALRDIGRENDATLFMVLLTLFNILVSRLSGQEDIVVGTPVAGRRHADLEKIIGMFVNTLPLRNFPQGEKTFDDFLGEVRERTLEAFDNQEYPFEDLVEQVQVRRDMSRNPLFDVMFILQNFDDSPEYDAGIVREEEQELEELNRDLTAKFDIALSALVSGDNITFAFNYCTLLFKEESIRRFAGYYLALVQAAIENPGQAAAGMEIMSPVERLQILEDFNNTDTAFPTGITIHRIFEEQAGKTPDREALVGPGLNDSGEEGEKPQSLLPPVEMSLTYREVNRAADQLAYRLQQHGVNPGTVVGIMAERSIHVVVGIMAILKAGGAYLPIDPGYPADRARYMLADSDAKILLSTKRLAGKIEFEKEILYLEDTLENNSEVSQTPALSTQPDTSPAYIIYTSGSTGNPKGVLIEHQSAVNILFSLNTLYPFLETDTYLFKTPYIFDVSVSELFGWFLGGGRLAILASGAEKEPPEITRAVERFKVTHINFVPSLFSVFVDLTDHQSVRQLVSLRYIFLAGEALPPAVVEKFRELDKNIRLENIYGPTEGTIYVSNYALAGWESGNSIPIGKPMHNLKLFIINKSGGLVPVGIPGELCVGGKGLARGYLNRPELTAEKFVRNPLMPLYKTGDLACWLPNGNIQYLGRMDHQVKIRGYRIELGEIENRLLKHPDVRETTAVVKSDDSGDNYICAYVTSEKELSPDDLKQYLTRQLPEYMVPAYFMQIPEIPLTPSGKIDRKALPQHRIMDGESITSPRNQLETTLVEIWSGILGMPGDTIGIDAHFFQLGGHSLKATVMLSRLHRELEVRIPLPELFRNPTIRRLSGYIRGLSEDRHVSIPAVEKKDYYALSSAQKRVYILQKMEPTNIVYNIPDVLHLKEVPDLERVQEVFTQLVGRHESFRTSFEMVGEEPVQRVHERVEFDIRSFSAAVESDIGRIIRDFVQPFDLTQPPLLRIGLLTAPGGKSLLLMDMHHIISDGTSIDVLGRDFMALYTGETLPPLRIQYKDFAEWQDTDTQKAAFQMQENFWVNTFAGEIPLLNLPYDYPRPAVQSFEGDTLEFSISRQECGALKTIAMEKDATLYMVLLAIFNILLFKLSGQEDIIVGTPVAGRRHADLENIIGMFVNTLALRNFPGGEKSFDLFLEELREQTLAAFENQDFPFENLVDKVNVNRDTGRNPLFDVMFILQNVSEGDAAEEEPVSDPYQYENPTAKFDLTFYGMETNGYLQLGVQYCTRLFKQENVDRFITYFKRIASAVVENSSIPLGQIEIIPEKEKQELLYDFNDTGEKHPTDKTIHELFRQQVELNPGNIALMAGEPLTYRQLDVVTEHLAHRLIRMGTTENHLVGLLADRSAEMIIGMLGILKAGGAYVPLNPKAPGARNKYIMEECTARLLVTTRDIWENGNGAHFENWDGESVFVEDFSSDLAPSNPQPATRNSQPVSTLAYVIFTSGSTGTPKGVPISHANLSPLLHWGYRELGLGPKDRVLQNLSYYFDWSVWEIFITLTSGAGLYIVSDEVLLDPQLCARYISEHAVTTLHITPTQYQYLVQTGLSLDSLEYLFIGAEKLTLDLVRRSLQLVNPGCRIFNMYGPTESTIITSVLEIDRDNLDPYEHLTSVPIGPPVANCTYYVLDKYYKPCPPMVTGELYIGGDGLASGYLNDPAKSAAAFVDLSSQFPDPRCPMPVYKAGDLARWLPDGTVEYLGRIDHQVKIRGYRIELGEIENQLLEHENIHEAVVIVRQDSTDDKYLCAYIVPGEEVNDEALAAGELKKYLSQSLPDYMVPSYFVLMEQLPLNANKKIDRKALPEPERTGDSEITAPRTDAERQLAGIWADVLGIPNDSIDIDGNFFQLGGHSLRATAFSARIRKEFQVDLPLVEIFKSPTIRELAQWISTAAESVYTPLLPVAPADHYELSHSQKRMWALSQLEEASIAFNIPLVQVLVGELDIPSLELSLDTLVKRHESLRTIFIQIDGEPRQEIMAPEDVQFKLEYIESEGNTGGETGMREWVHQELGVPFDLSADPLLKVSLIRIDNNKHLLFLKMHHIISDYLSFNVFIQEMLILYGAFLEGKPNPLEPLTIHYKDYAIWHNQQINGENFNHHREYWLNHLDGKLPRLELPLDKERPASQTFNGDSLTITLDAELLDELREFSEKRNATLFMTMLTTLNILFYHYTGDTDIILGTVIAGREHTDLGGQIGCYLNTLALRTRFESRESVTQVLENVKNVLGDAYRHQVYPFDRLVEDLNVGRDRSRHPIFDVMVDMLNYQVDHGDTLQRSSSGNILVEDFDFQLSTTQFELAVIFVEEKHTMDVRLEYNTDLFESKTIGRIMERFRKLLDTLLENPEAAVSTLRLEKKVQAPMIQRISRG